MAVAPNSMVSTRTTNHYKEAVKEVVKNKFPDADLSFLEELNIEEIGKKPQEKADQKVVGWQAS
ncbi:conserved hypothetical protein [Ricinus communis]|uniref:Uncharacterized protein n=1 Tax=Ricinus communis TaxID=3988 RepID=B9SAA9_RICCO|nr:conserved hypothetical protein [Ricinus communis]